MSTNYVPDETTAKKVAEAIWVVRFGCQILDQEPYNATLVDGVWIVKGLVPKRFRNNPDFRGGTAYIEIRKSDCKVLKVSHGR